MNTYLVREVAKSKDLAGKFYGNSFILKTFLIILSLLFLLIFSYSTSFDQETYRAIYIFAAYGILSSFVQLTTGVFRAFERMEFDTLIIILEKLIITSLGISVLVMGFGLLTFCLVFVGAGIISQILGLSLVRRKFFPLNFGFDFQFSRKIFLGAVVFGISMFLATIYNKIDVVMLSIMKSPQVVGWYSAAYKLLNFTNIVPTIFVIAFFPRMSQVSSDKLSNLFTKGMKYLLILAIPLVPGVVILAKKIVLLAFGAQYENSIAAMQILVIAAAILFLNIFLAGLYGATNNQNRLVFIQLGGLTTNVVLNLLLIPKYSYIGASVATVITEGGIFIVAFYWALQHIVQLKEFGFFFKSMASALVMTLLLFNFREINVGIMLVASILIYFIMLLLLGGIKIEEILSIKNQRIAQIFVERKASFRRALSVKRGAINCFYALRSSKGKTQKSK